MSEAQPTPTRGVAMEVYKRRRSDTSSDEDDRDTDGYNPVVTRVKLPKEAIPKDSLTPALMKIIPKLACQRKLYAAAPANVALRGMIRRLKEIYGMELHPGDHQRCYIVTKVGYVLSRITTDLTSGGLEDFRTNCSRIKGSPNIITSCGEFLESMERGDTPPTCDRLETAANDPKVKAVDILQKISGVGLITASVLYTTFGCSTINDVRRRDAEVPQPGGWPITTASRKGIANYEDWLVRIPRTEVEQVWDIIRTQATIVDPTAEGLVAGSYRRGQSTCGDIDVLWKTAKRPFIKLLVERLHQVGFLVDDLTVPKEAVQEAEMYMGVYRLGNGPTRRIDIKSYKPRDYAFALLYFTGDSHFGTSMRRWAGILGWSLSDKGLIPVKRDHEYKKTARGASISCATEEDIFSALGLGYIAPTDRGCK